MSIAALLMARAMATQYYSGNMYAAMDGELALGRANSGANVDTEALKNVANKSNRYAYMIENADMKDKIAKQLHDTEKALQDRYAKSFDMFGELP